MNTQHTEGMTNPASAGTTRLFDAHCHLQDERLAPHLDAFMGRAAAAGIAGWHCCGTRESDWNAIRRLAPRFPGIRVSFGLHPWYTADRTSGWLEDLQTLLRESPSGVGEIGLDHALDKETFAVQEEVFLAQISLAARLRRPVSVHCRRAWGRMMELLDNHGWPPDGILFHSYSGGAELVPRLVRRGAFFSFSGAITKEKNARAREAAGAIPADRILVETDAPDLLPDIPHQAPHPVTPGHSTVNEPYNLVYVIDTVAALRGWSSTQTAAITAGNAERFFARINP